MHWLRGDVIPGVAEQLIVEHKLVAGERRQLDDVDELARLDDLAHMVGIEELTRGLDLGREQGAFLAVDWLRFLELG